MAGLLGMIDVAVIGAGPAGYVAAIRAAQLGATVSLIEKDEVGGVCLNRGCIPTKALLESTNLLSKIRRTEKHGISVGNVSTDIRSMIQRKNAIVRRIVASTRRLIESYDVEIIEGTATITGSREIRVATSSSVKKIEASNIIIATGSEPASLGAQLERTRIITSDEALAIEDLPGSLLIIGGGVIGVEFACIFNRLGTDVTLVEMMPQLLPGEEEEIALFLKYLLEEDGVDVLTDSRVTKIEEKNEEATVAVATSDGDRMVTVEEILMAIGRVPKTRGLGLNEIKLDEDGRIIVDKRMETDIPRIYAIGDAVGRYMLAHVASAEAIVAAENVMGAAVEIDYNAVPRCVYASPEVASVGLTERQATGSGRQTTVGRFSFSNNSRALTLSEDRGGIKVVADAKSGEVLGVHMIGPKVSEMIHEAVFAMRLEATVNDIGDMIYAHPTLSEALKEAALDAAGRSIHKVRGRRNKPRQDHLPDG